MSDSSGHGHGQPPWHTLVAVTSHGRRPTAFSPPGARPSPSDRAQRPRPTPASDARLAAGCPTSMRAPPGMGRPAASWRGVSWRASYNVYDRNMGSLFGWSPFLDLLKELGEDINKNITQRGFTHRESNKQSLSKTRLEKGRAEKVSRGCFPRHGKVYCCNIHRYAPYPMRRVTPGHPPCGTWWRYPINSTSKRFTSEEPGQVNHVRERRTGQSGHLDPPVGVFWLDYPNRLPDRAPRLEGPGRQGSSRTFSECTWTPKPT